MNLIPSHDRLYCRDTEGQCACLSVLDIIGHDTKFQCGMWPGVTLRVVEDEPLRATQCLEAEPYIRFRNSHK